MSIDLRGSPQCSLVSSSVAQADISHPVRFLKGSLLSAEERFLWVEPYRQAMNCIMETDRFCRDSAKQPGSAPAVDFQLSLLRIGSWLWLVGAVGTGAIWLRYGECLEYFLASLIVLGLSLRTLKVQRSLSASGGDRHRPSRESHMAAMCDSRSSEPQP